MSLCGFKNLSKQEDFSISSLTTVSLSISEESTQTSESKNLMVCGFKPISKENQKEQNQIEIVTEFSQYRSINKNGVKKFSQNRYKQLENLEEIDINDIQYNLDPCHKKHIQRHKKNLFPYFSNHFQNSLKYDRKFQKDLGELCSVSNPVHYIISYINECKYKISCKRGLKQLIDRKDININKALNLWFSKYLVPIMNITKDSKNQKINQTHKIRCAAFLQSAQGIIDYMNRYM